MADNVKVTVRVDKRALDQQLLGRDGAVGKVIAGFAGLVTTEIKSEMRDKARGAYWPVTTSIRQGPRGTYSITTVKRTKPHPIDARRAPNLVFFWEREQVMFKGPHVNHPGSAVPEKLVLSGIDRASRRVTFTAAAPRVS
jgi:hypothetical protein